VFVKTRFARDERAVPGKRGLDPTTDTHIVARVRAVKARTPYSCPLRMCARAHTNTEWVREDHIAGTTIMYLGGWGRQSWLRCHRLIQVQFAFSSWFNQDSVSHLGGLMEVEFIGFRVQHSECNMQHSELSGQRVAGLSCFAFH